MTIADYKRIVAGIQAILASDVDPPASELLVIEREYQQAINEVNERLLEFEQFQSNGFRFDALQFTDEDPKLTEAIRILDFADLAAWNDYLAQVNLQPAPPLLTDLVIELGNAYTAHQALEPLLRKQRWHALSGSDLKTRCDLIRQIKKKEHADFVRFWAADLKELELEQISELETTAKRAASQRDIPALSHVKQELEDTPWGVGKPVTLIKSVSDVERILRRDAARATLERLVVDLNAAHSAQDKTKGKQHYAEWTDNVDVAELEPDDEKFDLVDPDLQWVKGILADEKQDKDFNDAVQILTDALDDKQLDLTLLNKLEAKVLDFNRDVSKVLLNRVTEKRHGLKLDATRKSRLVLLGVVAGVGLLATSVYFYWDWQSFSSEVAGYARQIKEQVEAKNLTGASDILKRLEQTAPKIRTAPIIVGWATTIADLERIEAGRVEKLEQLIASARELGVERARWENFKPAREILKQAEEVAAGESEDARIKEVGREITREEARLQKDSDTRFQADLDELVKGIEKLPPDVPAEYVATLSRLTELQSRPHVSTTFRAPIPALIEKVKQEQAAVERNLLTAKHLSKISESVGQRVKFVAALREHAREQPGTTRAADFLRVADNEAKLWDGVEAWARVRERWKREDLKSATSDRARELLAEYQKLNKETPYPGETGLTEKLPICSAIARRRMTDGTGLLDALEKLLDSPAYNNLYVVETVEGKRYYTNEVPTKMGGLLNVRYYLDLDLEQKKLIKLKMTDIPGAESRSVPQSWLSPQSRFREEALKLIKSTDKPWEEMFDDLIKLVQDDKQIDPILKVQLLTRLMDSASKGSTFLTVSLKTTLDMLSAGRLPVTANWLAPEDESVEKLRSRAKAILSTMASQKQNFADAITNRDKVLAKKVGPILRWVGWVRRERNAWLCYLSPANSAPANGDLVVVHAALDADAKPQLTKIGDLENGRAKVLETAFTSSSEHLRVEGRPLFLAIND